VGGKKTATIRTPEQQSSPPHGWWCPDRDPMTSFGAEATITSGHHPFPLPAFLGAQFAALRGYWNSLKHGNATAPFADDLSLAALGKLADTVALVRVSEKPQRFRLAMAAPDVVHLFGTELENRFTDEFELSAPLEYFASQCSATAESGAPTFFRHPEYRRLMLPFWGDGHINLILVSFEIGHEG
jgi:hypothetical protein